MLAGPSNVAAQSWHVVAAAGADIARTVARLGVAMRRPGRRRPGHSPPLHRFNAHMLRDIGLSETDVRPWSDT